MQNFNILIDVLEWAESGSKIAPFAVKNETNCVNNDYIHRFPAAKTITEVTKELLVKEQATVFCGGKK